MTTGQMTLAMQLGNGMRGASWRAPGVDPSSYTDFDPQVRDARAAERGKFAFLFVPDFLTQSGELNRSAPQLALEALITAAPSPAVPTHRG